MPPGLPIPPKGVGRLGLPDESQNAGGAVQNKGFTCGCGRPGWHHDDRAFSSGNVKYSEVIAGFFGFSIKNTCVTDFVHKVLSPCHAAPSQNLPGLATPGRAADCRALPCSPNRRGTSLPGVSTPVRRNDAVAQGLRKHSAVARVFSEDMAAPA